jgi:hypothetical protein
LNPSDAHSVITDMLKFLFLCGSHPDTCFIPPPRIDVCWREFVLFTRDYHAFCIEHFGRFIHYDPGPVADEASASQVKSTQQLATKIFGRRLSDNWDY